MDDFLTPKYIIDAVVKVLGSIGLDPCSEFIKPGEAYNVPAIWNVTPLMDGLRIPWGGSVFCNPPYSKKGRPGDWVNKAVLEAQSPITRIIMLLPARTETKWIRPLAIYPRVFLHGRVKFGVPPGQKDYGQGTFPSMIVGLNLRAWELDMGFRELGDTYAYWNRD